MVRWTHAAAIAVAALVSLPGRVQAQVPYDLTVETVLWVELPSGTTYQPVSYAFGYPAWDEGAVAVPIGFDFTWFGRTYSTVYVYTNGLVSFDPPPSGPAQDILRNPTTVPDPRNVPHNFIAPMWRNLAGAAMPEIRVSNQGTAPNRAVIIQVLGLRAEPGVATQRVAFQVRLQENGSARVTYHPNEVFAPSSTAAIEDATGTLGASLLTLGPGCDASCACAPGTCNSNNFVVPNNPGDISRSVVIRPPVTPELIVAVSGPDGAYPGTNFPATLLVTNVGLAAAGAFTAQIRLSSDTTIDTSDTLLRTVNFASLGASTTSSQSFSLTMPMGLPVARFYLGAIVDPANTVTESVETNNRGYDPGGLVTGPDLRATVAAPLNSGPGETIDLQLGILAAGAPVTQPVAVRFYLSQDARLDGADTQIHQASFMLPNGFSTQQTVAVTIPPLTAAGSYRVLVEVDPAPGVITELDENNNVGASPQPITLSLPDIEMNDPVAAGVAFRGLAYPITLRVTNRGGSGARGFTVCAVISRNPLISVVSDPVLARSTALELAGGESATIRLEPVIPVGTGTGAWHLAGVADCDEAVPESIETNNVRRVMNPITIMDPSPDFLPVELATAAAIAAGEAAPFSLTLGNYGTASGAAHVKLYLSDNAGVTPMDRLIYETPQPISIEAGREQPLSFQAVLPGDLQTGSYWIGAIVDPDGTLTEVDEDNNTLAIGPLPVIGSNLGIISPAPPAAVSGVSYVWRFAAGGGEGDYTWTLTWASGAAPSGLSFDAARGELSGTPDPASEGTHRLTVNVTSGTLSASQEYTLRITPPSLPLSIVSGKLPPALQDEPYSAQLVAVGGTPPYRWTLSGGRLPAGLSLSANGDLGGEASMVVAATFQVRVEDAVGASDVADVALDVIDPRASLSITTADVPSAMVGEAFQMRFEVSGGSAPHVWRLDGTPIPGLSFDGISAELTGTPTVAGSYPIIIEVRDARGLLDRNAYVLRVFELGELTIITGRSAEDRLPGATVGVPYTTEAGPVRLRAVRQSGATPEGLRWMVVLGELPRGLQLDPQSGEISGTPAEAGISAFTVLAHDASGDRDRVTLAIVVEPADGTTEPPVDEGCGCSAARGGASSRWAWLLVVGLVVLRRRLRVLASVVAVAVPLAAEAQVIPYTVSRETVAYQPLTGGTRLSPDLGDGGSVQLALPFEVQLYGQSSRTLWVNANGLVALAPLLNGKHFPPETTPELFAPNGWIAAMWSDWCSGGPFSCPFPDPVPGAGVYFAIDSTPGAGRVTVEYRNIRHFADDLTPSSVTFQITLHEGQASQIELHYGPFMPGTGFGGGPTQFRARIGVESIDGRTGMWIDPCGGPNACDTTQLAALSGTRIRLIADAGEDVTINALSVPPVGYPGTTLPITARVSSRHQQPLGPFVVGAYLLDSTASSTAGAERLALSAPVSLAPYASQTVALELPIPGDLPQGRYRVAVVADADQQLDEAFEDNNLALSGTIRVSGRAPDLAVLSARALSARTAPGESLGIAYRVRNAGNEPASAEIAAYLSLNEALTPSDRRLGAPVIVQLAPGQVATGTISAMLDAAHPTGLLYAGVIADPASTLDELDETNNAALAPDAVAVIGTGIRIVTEALPPATLTQSYSAQIEVLGGVETPVLRIVSGALPRGMAFEDGAIFGIPLETGSFDLELEATSGTATDRRTLMLLVIDPSVPLTIVTRVLPAAIVGTDYLAEVRHVGGTPPYDWRLIGRLPDGLALATDGTILGAPTEPGPSTFGLQLRDNAGATATAALSLEVRAPGNLLVATSALPEGVLGAAYEVQLIALGGVGALRWIAGGLPEGLVMTELGSITGTPEQAGEFAVSVAVEDEVANVDTNHFVLVVRQSGRLRLVTTELPEAIVGVPYRTVVRAEGGIRPYVWTFDRSEGTLPEGFVAGPSDGTLEGESEHDLVISGTLAREGVWPFTLRARDDRGQTVERPFALVGRVPPAPVMEEEEGCGCSSGKRQGGALVTSLLLLGALLAARRKF